MASKAMINHTGILNKEICFITVSRNYCLWPGNLPRAHIQMPQRVFLAIRDDNFI